MIFMTIFLLAIIVVLVYVFLTWNFNYWKNRGVTSPKPMPVLGNYPSLYTQKQHVCHDLDEIYRKYKKNEDFVGIFSCRTPQLLITNPQLAHKILVNDFKNFHDNEMSTMVSDQSDFILANNPFVLTGEKWKERRAEVTPGLTSNRIKTVFPVTTKICSRMTNYIKEETRVPPKEGLDMKDVALRFTSEVVTDCVLGLNAASFSKTPTPILGHIKKLFEESFSFIAYSLIVGFLPYIKKFYKARFVPKESETFFVDLMQNSIDIRRNQLKQNFGSDEERTDFLQYMLQLQEKKQLNTKQLAAHTMTFLFDGFETTAGVITHCLLLLARHAEAQTKLRQEIEEHLKNKNDIINYDLLNELPYLDACVHESLRMFSPGLLLNKICTESIELTNKNGKKLKLEKGIVVVLPLYSYMYDERFYDEPQEFVPERFLEENGGVKKYREQGAFLGFGDGPRVCLGMRFALTQTKAAIVEIIRNFNITPNPKTRKDNTLNSTYFLALLEGGIWLDFEARN